MGLAGSLPAWGDPWIKGDYFKLKIVVPETPSPTLSQAAEDFKQLWMLCTGTEIEIGTKMEGEALVWLGPDILPESLVKREELDGLGDEGFIIRSYSPNRRDRQYRVGMHLVISGRNDDATRKGVFEYFDRFLNMRQFTPGERNKIFLDKAGAPEVDLRYVPAFRFREVGYFGLWGKEKGGAEWRDWLRMSPVFQPSFRRYAGEPAPQGDGQGIISAGKAAEWIVANRKAKAETLPRGVRTVVWRDDAGEPVTCWTLNRIPGMDPSLDAAVHGDEGVVVALGLAEEVLAGLDEGDMVRVALPPTCPLPPADRKLDARVVIHLTNAACDFSRPLLEAHCPENQRFLDALAAWRATGATLFVSDAIASTRSTVAPFPNLNVVRENLYALTQYEVAGVYAECWDFPEAKVAEADRLRGYLMAVLLWNPDRVVEDLVAEFIKHHYGPASGEVAKVFTAYAAALAESGKPLHTDGPPDWLTPAKVREAEQGIAAALKTEMDNKFKTRVSALVNTLEYAQLLCPPALETAADGSKVWKRPQSRSFEQVVERWTTRGIAVADPRFDLLKALTVDCGGVTPPRDQPFVEGQEPK